MEQEQLQLSCSLTGAAAHVCMSPHPCHLRPGFGQAQLRQFRHQRRSHAIDCISPGFKGLVQQKDQPVVFQCQFIKCLKLIGGFEISNEFKWSCQAGGFSTEYKSSMQRGGSGLRDTIGNMLSQVRPHIMLQKRLEYVICPWKSGGTLQISAGSQESYRLLGWLKPDLLTLHIQPLPRF